MMTKRICGRILAVIALALFFRGASLNSKGYYQPGLYAGGAMLVLVATALGITSFIMLRRRSQPAGVGVAPVTVSASSNSNRNRTSTQQQPPMTFMMAGAQPDQHPPSQPAPGAPTVPVVQPVVSSPVADAASSARRRPDRPAGGGGWRHSSNQAP
jgi:hypothetical protein